MSQMLNAAKRAKELLDKEKPKTLDEWVEWYNFQNESDVVLWAILHAKFAVVSTLPTERVSSDIP